MSRSIAEKSIETQLIEKRLLQLEEGESITYKELSDIIGGDVQFKCRARLQSALRILQNEHNRLFSTVFNEGVKRINPSEAVADLSEKRKKIRKVANRLKKRSTVVDWERLTPDEKRQLNAERTILSFVSDSSSDKQVAKIASAINGSGEALPAGKVLELFAKK